MNNKSICSAAHQNIAQARKKPDEESHRAPRLAHKLYIWFHGLFGFYFKSDYITVVTPYMQEHSYFAGSWLQERKLKGGEWYRLIGVGSAERTPAPQIDPTKDATLSGISKVDLDSSYFLLRLDFPKRIIPVRYVDAKFTGSASAQLHTPFPLVHLFEYEVTDPASLRVDRLDWRPSFNEVPGIMNLHVFAEPQDLVPNEHAMHAFMSLVSLFPGTDLQLQDSTYKGEIPLDWTTPAGNLPCGLDPNEERSLAERGKSGTQPANCFALLGQP